MPGFKTEVLVEGKWSQNGVVWPDRESAEQAGVDLLGRWFVPTDSRAVEVSDDPNRPTWTEHTARHGLPPRSVSL